MSSKFKSNLSLTKDGIIEHKITKEIEKPVDEAEIPLTLKNPPFAPSRDNLIIDRIPAREKTVSGIIIPESVQDEMAKGIVVKIGPEVTGIAIGDVVMVDPNHAKPMYIENHLYFMMTPYGVFGTYTNVKYSAGSEPLIDSNHAS